MPPSEVTDDQPIMLRLAAELAFPDGTMSVSGLRRERDAGRLLVERIAGRDYTTLNNIKAMRRLCQVAKGHGSSPDTPEVPARRTGLSSTRSTVDMKKAQDAALTIVEGLSGRSRNISRASMSLRPIGT